jgi:hypothetical protein
VDMVGSRDLDYWVDYIVVRRVAKDLLNVVGGDAEKVVAKT